MQIKSFGLLLACLVTLAGCSSDSGPSTDSETHWQQQGLVNCSEDAQCADGLSCLCGVCSQDCGADSNVCTQNGARAVCTEETDSNCASSPADVCRVSCTADAECQAYDSMLGCVAGWCAPQTRTPEDDAGVSDGGHDRDMGADAADTRMEDTGQAVCRFPNDCNESDCWTEPSCVESALTPYSDLSTVPGDSWVACGTYEFTEADARAQCLTASVEGSDQLMLDTSVYEGWNCDDFTSGFEVVLFCPNDSVDTQGLAPMLVGFRISASPFSSEVLNQTASHAENEELEVTASHHVTAWWTSDVEPPELGSGSDFAIVDASNSVGFGRIDGTGIDGEGGDSPTSYERIELFIAYTRTATRYDLSTGEEQVLSDGLYVGPGFRLESVDATTGDAQPVREQ